MTKTQLPNRAKDSNINKSAGEIKKTGLELLREPFSSNQISKLPKPTKIQTDKVKRDYRNGIRCKECGGWHHKDVIHLDYVGHAALTDRLLDCDTNWSWKPMALSSQSLPCFDSIGGLWIELTVCGKTMLGYGSADGKQGGNAIKECIGDALRNAAMRMGAALDLWHKGDLHIDDDENEASKPAPMPKAASREAYTLASKAINSATTIPALEMAWKNMPKDMPTDWVEELKKEAIERKVTLLNDDNPFDDE